MVDGRAGLRLRLFGVPRLEWAGAEVRLATRKAVALLAYLAVRGGEVPRSEVAELLWTHNAMAALRLELHRLRALPGAAQWLHADGALHLDAGSDHAAFEAALARGDDGAALRLFDGSDETVFLHGLELRRAPAFDEWRAAERSRLDEVVREALARRAEGLRRRGELTRAERYAERLLSLDPSDEAGYRLLIQTALERGDLRAAQRAYERCKRVLVTELGTEPAPETRDLGQAVEWSLALPSVTVGTRRIPPELLRPPVLAGRERAWRQLERAWRERRIVFVGGPAGIGKTRLVMDFVEAVAPGQYAILHGRPGDAARPYATLARGMRVVHAERPAFVAEAPAWSLVELARLLPDVLPDAAREVAGDARPAVDPSGGGNPPHDDRRRGIEAALAVLVEAMFRAFDAYLADDLHLFDERSFRATGSVLQRLVRTRDGVFGRSLNVFRSDELPPAWRAGIEAAVAAGAAELVDLSPLDRSAVHTLLDGLGLGIVWSESVVGHLHERSGGNPLYLLEFLRGLAERGQLDDPHLLPSDLRATARVRLTLGRRIERLPEVVQRVARLLAVLSEDADPALLRELAGESAEDVNAALAELARAQVVDGMRFTHDLQREALLAEIEAAERGQLEALVAAALERAGASPERIAERWLAAGDAERGWSWYLVAAEEALAAGLPETARPWLERVRAARGAAPAVRERAAAMLA